MTVRRGKPQAAFCSQRAVGTKPLSIFRMHRRGDATAHIEEQRLARDPRSPRQRDQRAVIVNREPGDSKPTAI